MPLLLGWGVHPHWPQSEIQTNSWVPSPTPLPAQGLINSTVSKDRCISDELQPCVRRIAHSIVLVTSLPIAYSFLECRCWVDWLSLLHPRIRFQERFILVVEPTRDFVKTFYIKEKFYLYTIFRFHYERKSIAHHAIVRLTEKYPLILSLWRVMRSIYDHPPNCPKTSFLRPTNIPLVKISSAWNLTYLLDCDEISGTCLSRTEIAQTLPLIVSFKWASTS